jgi:hypothetical protein
MAKVCAGPEAPTVAGRPSIGSRLPTWALQQGARPVRSWQTDRPPGDQFADDYVFIKNAEFARFKMEVTEWEQAEYFRILTNVASTHAGRPVDNPAAIVEMSPLRLLRGRKL